MFTVDNKFDVGQEVYVIKKENTKEPCPICNGIGHKIIDGNKFSCCKCNGSGSKLGGRCYQVYGAGTVTLIKTLTQLQGKDLVKRTNVIYNVGDMKEVPEQFMFTDEEEAIKECERLNMYITYDEWGKQLLKEQEESENGKR